MREILLIVNIAALLVLVIRFMQPQFIYWARRVVVDVRLSKFFIDKDRGKKVSQRDYIKLFVQDLRPEGVTSLKDITSRINKLRVLYNILDIRRPEMRGIPEAKNSQECVLELANLLAVLARYLRPSNEYDYGSIKANELLHMIAIRRATKANGIEPPPPPGDEDALEHHFKKFPLTLEQLNEVVIAAIYGALYRVPPGAEAARHKLWAFTRGKVRSIGLGLSSHSLHSQRDSDVVDSSTGKVPPVSNDKTIYS